MNPHCYEGFLLGQMRSSVRIPADPRATAVRRSQSQNARTAQVDTRLISCHRNLRDKAFMLIIGSTYLRIQFSDCKFVALPTRDSFRQNISQSILHIFVSNVWIWQLRSTISCFISSEVSRLTKYQITYINACLNPSLIYFWVYKNIFQSYLKKKKTFKYSESTDIFCLQNEQSVTRPLTPSSGI